MSDADRHAVLEIVDRVLGDLALRDRMFVGRRPEAGESGTVVIQTSEEGRYRLALPELGSARSIETFMAAAQAHLGEVFAPPRRSQTTPPAHWLDNTCSSLSRALVWRIYPADSRHGVRLLAGLGNSAYELAPLRRDPETAAVA